ncbi:MAG: group III truncated hemoglobin [Edaphobacter sp.]
MSEQKVTEEEISNLVDRFYAKVQRDPEIGPIFNETIKDWPTHLALLKNFWSTVMLTTGRYKGDPMMTHLQLPLEPSHFNRWLSLFAETARQVMSPDHAASIIAKSERIATNFKAGMAYQKVGFAQPQ